MCVFDKGVSILRKGSHSLILMSHYHCKVGGAYPRGALGALAPQGHERGAKKRRKREGKEERKKRERKGKGKRKGGQKREKDR